MLQNCLTISCQKDLREGNKSGMLRLMNIGKPGPNSLPLSKRREEEVSFLLAIREARKIWEDPSWIKCIPWLCLLLQEDQ